MEDILDFFTTIPGILIICGVVLLIISMILFITGNKKSKKENIVEEQKNNEVEENSVQNNESAISFNNIDVTPVVPVEVEESNTNEEVASTSNDESVNSEINNFDLNATVQESENNYEMPEYTVPETTSMNIDEPVVTESVPEFNVNNDIQQTSSPIEMPSFETTVINNEENVATFNDEIKNINQPVAEEPVVYGGVNPTFDFQVQNEKPVSIYGGNDPLEKTQSIPKVEEHHEPYGGVPEIKIVEPVFEQPIIEQPMFNETVPEFNHDVTTINQEENKFINAEPVTNITEPVIPQISEEPIAQEPVFTPINENTVTVPEINKDEVEEL